MFFSSSLLLSSPELGDTKVYAPEIRALLGIASHFYEAVILQLKTLPFFLESGSMTAKQGDARGFLGFGYSDPTPKPLRGQQIPFPSNTSPWPLMV